MKVTAYSSFHPSLSRSFSIPAEPGEYYRRVPNACNGVNSDCICGWPCGRTTWDCPDGFVVTADFCCVGTHPDCGHNNIVIHVRRVDHGC